MKLPPASRKASYTFRDSSLAAPQPQSSPKVIVPSAASETRSPLLPKSRYFIRISFPRSCILASTNMNACALMQDSTKLPARNPRPEYFKPRGPVHLCPFRLPHHELHRHLCERSQRR